MKLKGVTINNYKSFGEKDNFLYLDKLNAIIGKNESGKSNIIDCISGIDMIGITGQNFFYPQNRRNNKDIQVELFFETYDKETTLYGFKGNATVKLDSYENYYLSGDLSKFIEENKRFNGLISSIEEIRTAGLHFSNQGNQKKFEEVFERLKASNYKIFVEPQYYNDFIKLLKNNGSEVQKQVANLIDDAYNFLENVYTCFPNFIKIQDLMLNSKYNLDTVRNDELLGQFLEICDINIDELLKKMNSNDTSDIRNYEDDINEKIKNNFTNDFNKFYNQENVKIKVAITSKEITMMVDTSRRYLDYDERSNGLKWYISTFIQLQYMERKNCESTKNNILLMDEPGVYLHANAQREVVKLLFDLVKNKNQIIYTTHSPFMLDIDAIQNVRTIIKDNDGFSHIYNKITNIPTKAKSTYDTITPLTNALGLNLNYNIGPSFSNKNIIVEGITDYFYLQGYYKSKKSKNIPNIIPSTGANNILAISSILFGWHCDFNILVDQDDKGRSIYDSLYDKNQPFLDKLVFADGNCEKVLESDYEIENLFSDSDKIKFGIKNDDYSEHKYNYAYVTYSKTFLEEEKYDDETMKNFDKIIKQINNLNKSR